MDRRAILEPGNLAPNGLVCLRQNRKNNSVVRVSTSWFNENNQNLVSEEIPTPILDLTTLLTTGRPTESLLDFLGSGEQMSERVPF